MTAPLFMSRAHVDTMNELLADAAHVRTACGELDRGYVVGYELHEGPEGRTVYWSMVFDPHTGVVMGLEEPDLADVTFVGDWARVVAASAAGRRGEQRDPGVDVRGDPTVLDRVGDAFAAAQRVATVDVTFPDLDDG